MKCIVCISHIAQAQSRQASNLDWGMLGVGISTLSLLVAIIIGIIQINAAQRPKKDIRCTTFSTAPLVSINKRFREDLQVFFKGQIIEDATFVILEISNSGKLAITPSDFIRPIAFIFALNAEIISAEILNMEPENLGAEILISKNNTIELKPLLMNSGDSIYISTIVTSFDKKITVDGRIIDIKIVKISKKESNEDKLRKLSNSFQFIILILLFVVVLSSLSNALLNKTTLYMLENFLDLILKPFGF
jgi:hypothetical protein